MGKQLTGFPKIAILIANFSVGASYIRGDEKKSLMGSLKMRFLARRRYIAARQVENRILGFP